MLKLIKNIRDLTALFSCIQAGLIGNVKSNHSLETLKASAWFVLGPSRKNV